MPPSYTDPVPEKETAAYKAAKMAVIVLSVLIVLALGALVVGGIFKLSGKSKSTPAPAAPAAAAGYQLPAGSRIVEMQSQPGRLILRVQNGAREEIDIFDTQDGRLVGQVKAAVARP
jgi:flagellar basal body-associated protein FliL